jgi:predicted secreted acid phosphatase
MKKIIFVGVLLTLTSCIALAQEPANLYFAKQQLIKYHDSGAYNRDIALVAQNAENYLKQALARPATDKRKLAIVLDIDDTALSGYENWKALGFGGTSAAITEVIHKGDETPLAGVVHLYNFAKEHKVAVFFITGRPESLRSITEKNLLAAGYKNWDGLYLRSEDYNKTYKTIVPYKAATRKQIIAQGYDIVINMGDQQSDLDGGYADRNFKLPNPYYLIP